MNGKMAKKASARQSHKRKAELRQTLTEVVRDTPSLAPRSPRETRRDCECSGALRRLASAVTFCPLTIEKKARDALAARTH